MAFRRFAKRAAASGVLIIIGLFLFLPISSAWAVGAKRIGDECKTDSECISSSCEKSDIIEVDDNQKQISKYYCTCGQWYTVGQAKECFIEYKQPEDKGEWSCSSGSDASHQLHYCYSSHGATKFPLRPAKPTATDALTDLPAWQAGLQNEIQSGAFKPKLQIRIPQLSFTDISQPDEEGYLHIPWIGQYIAAIYKYGMAVASIIAVAMIIKKGLDIAISGGAETAEHYKRIGQIVIGLVLLWGSYTIMFYINPDLVSFKALRVKYVQKIPFNLAENETEEAADPPETKPGNIQKIVTIQKNEFMANSMTVGESIAEDIKKAAQELYNETKGLPGGPYKLAGGGYRPLGGKDGQIEKWERQCEGKAKCGIPVCNPFPKNMMNGTTRKSGATADPTLCPHSSGVALDIYCQGGGIEKFFAPCQRKLEEILLRKNFCRLTSEPWHFEKPKMSGFCKNITGTAFRKATNETWDYSGCNGTYVMKTKSCS